MAAFLDCCQASGIQTEENSMSADAAVIWSVLWAGRMAGNRSVYEHYRQQGKPVIIVEVGALYRGRTWKVAVNHITRQGYYGHEQNLDWDRPRRLQISQAITFNDRPHVVIAAQHAQSLQVADIDIVQWCKEKVNEIKMYTDRPILIRPHPRSRLRFDQLLGNVQIEQPRAMPNTYDSFDLRFDYHAVVNYNSGPGVQAAIAGCRPVVHQSSLASPVSMHMIDIEKPYTVDRDLWLTQICHTEYTIEELRTGLWLKRIESALAQ